jgi:hypothetical protein
MRFARLKITADLRLSIADMSRHLHLLMRRMWQELVAEFARLNSARLGNRRLLQLARRDRIRAVKADLAAHHRGNARCC